MKLLKKIKKFKTRRSRRIAAVGTSTSLVVATLLGGLSLVLISLRNARLRVEIARTDGSEERSPEVG